MDAYFHIAKKGMASHVKVLDMLQDLNSFPEFACLDRHDALQEELEMNTTMAHKSKIRKLVQEATDQVMDEAAVITHKGLAQPRQLSSSSTEFMGMAVALRDCMYQSQLNQLRLRCNRYKNRTLVSQCFGVFRLSHLYLCRLLLDILSVNI